MAFVDCFVGVVVLGGGDWMWHHRLLVPVIVGVWILSPKIDWGLEMVRTNPFALLLDVSSACLECSEFDVDWKTLSITEYQEGISLKFLKTWHRIIRAVYPIPYG